MLVYTGGMSDITPEDLLPAGFQATLRTLLVKHPQGLDEFSLIRALAAAYPESLFAAPGALREPLRLFQTHFLLFHELYKLSDRLSESGLELGVHALRIRLQVRAAGGTGLVSPDPLRSYYLDWQHWLQTQGEDVQKLLEGLQQGALAIPPAELNQALGTFGLADPTTPAQVKQRYRELVRRHHPDRGGDTGQAQQVNHAFVILQRYYGKA